MKPNQPKFVPMKPTVGRIVHFHLGGSIPLYDARGNFTLAPEQDTYAAMVAAVDHDGVYVNLTVSDHYGNTFGRTMIPFVQPGVERPAGAWCEWPPIQNSGRIPTLNTILTLNTDVNTPTRQEFQNAVAEGSELRDPRNLEGMGTQQTEYDLEQASRRAEEKHANDLVEANVAAIRAEKERIRHPVIAAAQQLDNDGNTREKMRATLGPSATDADVDAELERQAPHIPQDKDDGTRRFAVLDQTVERVKAHNANVPPEVLEREIDEAVTAVRAGRPVDEPGTGPFDSPAPTIPQD